MKVRSMVGLIPLFAVEVLDNEVFQSMPEFTERFTMVSETPARPRRLDFAVG